MDILLADTKAGIQPGAIDILIKCVREMQYTRYTELFLCF